MKKVYLHKAGEESKVFNAESKAYEEALENGWGTERKLEDPKEQEVTDIKDIDNEDVAGVFTLAEVSDEDLLEEVEKRGLGPQAALDALEDIVEDQNEDDTGSDDQDQAEDDVKLTDLKKPQLQEIAKDLEIEFTSKTTIKQLIDLIMEAQDEK